MMTEQIKACPFCGSEEAFSRNMTDDWHVVCKYCGSTGPDADRVNDAILLWNAAANALANKDESIAELREKVELYKGRAEEATREWTEERSRLYNRIEQLFAERDEARKVAKVWYNAAGVWKDRHGVACRAGLHWYHKWAKATNHEMDQQGDIVVQPWKYWENSTNETIPHGTNRKQSV
jgi:Lar family restriction alleviation protein